MHHRQSMQRFQEQFLGPREEKQGRDTATDQLISGSPTFSPLGLIPMERNKFFVQAFAKSLQQHHMFILLVP